MGPSVLSVRVSPSASETRCESIADDGSVRIRVQASPEKGKANQALVRFLAKRLRVGRSQIEWISGEASRHKRLRIHGLDAQEIYRRLGSDL